MSSLFDGFDSSSDEKEKSKKRNRAEEEKDSRKRRGMNPKAGPTTTTQSKPEGKKEEDGAAARAAAAAFSEGLGAKAEDEAEEGGGAAVTSTSSALLPQLSVKAEGVAGWAGSSDARACSHQVVYPPQHDPLISEGNKTKREVAFSGPARTYPFPLDPFQKESIRAIEAGESVLVAAHTSAGKTVVAEYAIAQAIRDKARVIYTSPIKALSNQKYRDFTEIFGGDVGLMTGDVTIQPNASCLVMTTEILRSMLYRGSEVMREVQWVVFDEVHYLRDKERGVVWEETLILLPEKVHYVFLSATIPNAPEFAGWIAQLHHQPVHVVYTDYRPTPLQHYVFPAGGDGIQLVVDEKGLFREDNFQKALSILAPDPIDELGSKAKKNTAAGEMDVYKIVKMIVERNYDPVIVFGFSRKECESMAQKMNKLDLHSPEEKELVSQVFKNALDTLNEDDRELPMIKSILPLLKRGIGIHHSGLLPILKEVIEILFQENLIKVLFATETFSIGLNMPAKTVVFTSMRKFDGSVFRFVSSGEYVQMSGRAGRRGKDARGIVIMMLDEKMEPDVAKNMLKGGSDNLYSAFHLSYNTLLNLLRVEAINPEELLSKSFLQYQNEQALPALKKTLEEKELARNSITIEDEDAIALHFALRDSVNEYRERVRTAIIEPQAVLRFLQPGRLVYIRDGATDWGWGVCLGFSKKAADKGNGKGNRAGPAAVEGPVGYVLDVLLMCDADPNLARLQPPGMQAPRGEDEEPLPALEEMRAVPVLLSLVHKVSSIRVHLPADLRPPDSRKSVAKAVAEVARRKGGIPELDPVEDMGIKSPEFLSNRKRLISLEKELAADPLTVKPDEARFELYRRKQDAEADVKAVQAKIKAAETIVCRDSLKCMKRVLRRLKYTNEDDVITTKGKAACEINTADELLITELIFNGAFNELSPGLTAALCSCLVYQEKSSDNLKLSEELSAPFRVLKEAAKQIGQVCIESKITLDLDEYVDSFKPDLMAVVLQWTTGAKFAEICKLTPIFEGSIIRAMRRLDEFLRQVSNACSSIGEADLSAKFLAAADLLKRDIVFANSLYL